MTDFYQDRPQRRTAADPDLGERSSGALPTVLDQRECLASLIKSICTFTHSLRPGEVFMEIGPDGWESLKTRAPKAQQIAGGNVQIHDLTGIRILLNPDYGHRWELRHSVSGDVLYEGTEP
jgi:hypothetical protein